MKQPLGGVPQDSDQPNLRQGPSDPDEELHDETRQRLRYQPGDRGRENITTPGVDLPGLCPPVHPPAPGGKRPGRADRPAQSLLVAGQLPARTDRRRARPRRTGQSLIRKAGVMAIVLEDGEVRPGDAIDIQLPPALHRALRRSEAIRRDSGQNSARGPAFQCWQAPPSTTRSHSM
ncbi:hypothetical protein ACPA9J_04650 [Pseudomonas aeruginosa]